MNNNTTGSGPGATGSPKTNDDQCPYTPAKAYEIYRALTNAAGLVGELSYHNVLSAKGIKESICKVCDDLMTNYGGTDWDEVREKVREKAKKLILLSDVAFPLIFRDEKGLVGRLIEATTGKKNVKIVTLHMQMRLVTLDGKRVSVLDCMAIDSEGNIYDLEPQIRNDGATGPRALKYTGKTVSFLQESGVKSKKPPELWIIFLCYGDPRGEKQVLYEEEFAEHKGKHYGHIVYFSTYAAQRCFKKKGGLDNPQGGIDSERWKKLLIWGVNLRAKNSREVLEDEELEKRVRIVMDTDERGWSAVSDELLDWFREAEAKGKAEAKAEDAKAMLANRVSLKTVCLVTGMDREAVKQLRASMKSASKSA